MPHKATAIANEFLRRGGIGRLTQMQLQKLTYIAHGWTLALANEPLIEDSIEAWDYGPVIPELYDHTRFFGSSPIDRLIRTDDSSPARFFGGHSKAQDYSAHLNPTEDAIVQHVWQRYGNLTAFQLSNMTHQPDTPWYNTYTKQKRGRISDDVIKQHYLAIAQNAKSGH